MLEPGIICFYVFLNHISSLKQQQQQQQEKKKKKKVSFVFNIVSEF